MGKAPRLWLTGLAATVAALPASPALASGTAELSHGGARVSPLPAASWHGRPIRRPQPSAAAAAVAVPIPRGARTPLRPGAGYGRPGGFAAVRDVQRLLHRIGYRPGPVDGLFGARTRASVQWFQIKHGLRPSGVVGPTTLAFLRLRAAGVRVPGQAGRGSRAVSPGPVTALANRGSPRSQPAGQSHTAIAALALGIAAVLILLAGGTSLWRRELPRAKAAASAKRPPSPSPAPVATAVGYVTGRDRAEIRRRAQAIERACSDRGWTLARVVQEGHGNGAQGKARRGLAVALDQLAEGAGDRLVACRLQDLGTTRRDLARLIAWCGKSHVDLIALDVGLDTATTDGRLAARCLAAVGDREREASPRPRSESRGNRKRATAGANVSPAPAVPS
jgi:peptidoglycan hydrolase-like protein with peptidoglycan-binding domain